MKFLLINEPKPFFKTLSLLFMPILSWLLNARSRADRKVLKWVAQALVCLSLCLSVHIPSALASASLDVVKAQARQLKLSEDKEWLRILFYVPFKIFGPSGMFDDPAFYLTPAGKTDPQAELDATLEAFLTQEVGSEPDQHPLCRFPARKAWLSQRLGLAASDWATVPCQQFDKWWAQRNYDRMSLVFSSFFADSPPSLFGHLFIRLHRPRTGVHQSDLLDEVINYAAYPEDDNAIVYALKGGLGGYPGRFSLLPYYMKIQEYNNLESRDLWEYELDANPDQIKKMLLSLWELGPVYANYYYFDDNCSYIPLQLLETVRSDWNFTERVKYWATPSEGLKSVVGTPGVVRGERYRPSALSRYAERFDQLAPREIAALKELIAQQKLQTSLAAFDQASAAKRKVIDAALEYIDFKEKLGADELPEKFAQLRGELLQSRRSLGPADRLQRTPLLRNPANGDSESWLMLGASRVSEQSRLRLSWQPVLHDLLSDDNGYADGMQIQIMPMQFEYVPEASRLLFSRVDVLNLISLHGEERLLTPASWRFRLAYERESVCLTTPSHLCSKSAMEFGYGYAVSAGTESQVRVTMAGLIAGAGGGLGRGSHEAFIQAGPEVFILMDWYRLLRLQLRGDLAQRGLRGSNEQLSEWEGSVGLTLAQSVNLRGTYRMERALSNNDVAEKEEYALGLLHYF